MPYSADEKARALQRLQDNNGDIRRTSAETGISPRTLRRWSAADTPEAPEAENALEDSLHELREQLIKDAVALAVSLLDVIEDAPLNQRATALNQLIDKILKLADDLPDTEVPVIRIEYEDPEDAYR